MPETLDEGEAQHATADAEEADASDTLLSTPSPGKQRQQERHVNELGSVGRQLQSLGLPTQSPRTLACILLCLTLVVMVVLDPSLIPGATTQSQTQQKIKQLSQVHGATLKKQQAMSLAQQQHLSLLLNATELQRNQAQAQLTQTQRANEAALEKTMELEKSKQTLLNQIAALERTKQEMEAANKKLIVERDNLVEKINRLEERRKSLRNRMRARVAAAFETLTQLHRDVMSESMDGSSPALRQAGGSVQGGESIQDSTAAQLKAHARTTAALVRPGENQPPPTLAVQLKAAPAKSTPRIFDLVLFSAADRELVPLRIQELQGQVDVIVLAESEFRFSDGRAKPSAFDPAWLKLANSLGVDVRHFKITYVGLEVCSNRALKPGGNTKVRDDRMRKKPGLLNAKCRESFGRNGLVQAFNELGGTDDDIALISDADEIPRAAAMSMVRRLTIGRVATSLGAVHHFKYTVRCERGWRSMNPGSTWLKGPIATTGRYLRAAGAQSIRTPDGCVEVGIVPKCYGHLNRAAIANASWHLSSLSGGVDGVVRKMKDNAANVLYDKNQTLFLTSTVQERAQDCRHGENTNSKGAVSYERTPWGKSLAPRYPDVPAALENALKQQKLTHFLSWEPRTVPLSFAWDLTHPAPVQQVHPQRWHYRQTWGPCNRQGCREKKL